MKKALGIAVALAVTMSSANAVDKLDSFDHAAELTSHAKRILFAELNEERVSTAYHQQIVCLAENIYFESRAESFSGKAAVANVTRNRVEDDRWPSTYCEVVQQGPVRESWKTKKNPDLPKSERVYYPIKHRCQFSWYCDGMRDIIWANKEMTKEVLEGNARAWRESVRIAIWTLGQGEATLKDNTNGAVFYYNHNLVDPYWASVKEYLGQIGNHTFMK